jgi:methyl acetate hydrolase
MAGQSAIDGLLRRAVEEGDVPGVVAVAVNDRAVLYEGAFGVRSLDGPEPMQLDSVLWYASMTKALVAVAAMQLVEQGRIDLDEPLGELLPYLKAPPVLEGFDDDGRPRLRPSKGAITLRHLLTHTAGFGYDIWNADVGRYMRDSGIPALIDCKTTSLEQPLVADPGSAWVYGISLDWVGQVVEALSGKTLEAYLLDHVLKPLGATDTCFVIRPHMRPRLATVHQRQLDGSLKTKVHEVSQEPEFHMGGGGLYGTARDYAAFVQMMLNDGRARNGAQVLESETIGIMGENSVGELKAGVLEAVLPELSHSVDFFPGNDQKWGLSFHINMTGTPTGRSAGTLSWGGLANSYFWIDRKRRIGGVIMTQILPFADPLVLRLYRDFETAVYRELAGAAVAAH